VLAADSLPDPTQLNVGTTNYLVLSEKVKTVGGSKNGSSIFETSIDESFNSFWQALAAMQRNPTAQFDYYTSVKLHRFAQSIGSICQGFNVPSIIGNTLFDNQERQDNGIPPSREVGIQVSALPYYLTPMLGIATNLPGAHNSEFSSGFILAAVLTIT